MTNERIPEDDVPDTGDITPSDIRGSIIIILGFACVVMLIRRRKAEK